MQFQGDYYIMIKPDGVARPFKVLCKMFNNSGKRLGIGYSFICVCVNCSFVVVLSLLLCFVLFYCSTVAVSDSVDEIYLLYFFFLFFLNCLLFLYFIAFCCFHACVLLGLFVAADLRMDFVCFMHALCA